MITNQNSTKFPSICMVLDSVTHPDWVQIIGNQLLKSATEGEICFALYGTDESGRRDNIILDGLKARFIQGPNELHSYVLEGQFKILHIVDSVGFDEVLDSKQLADLKNRGVKVILEGVKSTSWDISRLKQVDQFLVYSLEDSYRLVERGIEAGKILKISLPITKPETVPANQLGIMRKGFGLPESNLMYVTKLDPGFISNLSDLWTIVTPDSLTKLNPDTKCKVINFHFENFFNLRAFVRCCDILVFTPNTDVRLLNEAIVWGVKTCGIFQSGLEEYQPFISWTSTIAELTKICNGFVKSPTELKFSPLGFDNSVQERDDQLLELYGKIKVLNNVAKASNEANSTSIAELDPIQSVKSAKRLRVLLQNRPNANQCPGGDTVVMNRLAELLKESGIEVVIDHSLDIDYRKFDLVHLFNFAIPQLLEQYAKGCKALGVPYVITALNEDVENFHFQSHAFSNFLIDYVNQGQTNFNWSDDKLNLAKAPRFQNDYSAANAALIFCSGEAEEKIIKSHYGNVKTKVIKFGVELGSNIPEFSNFSKTYGVSDYILCVGRLETRKNQLALLKALENSDHCLVLASGGFTYSPEYSKACRNFRRQGRTIILERLSNDELIDLYIGAKVHVLPSWYELPGLVTLEAMSLGCQVVVTDTGTTRDYVGNYGFYCSPSSPESIFNAISSAYSNPFYIEDLKACANKYTWNEFILRTIKAYETVLDRDIKVVTSQTESVTSQFTEVLESGEQNAKLKKFDLALADLNKALELNSNSSRAHRALGAVYLAKGEVSKAKTYFQNALEVDSKDARALSGLAMTEINQGNFRSAHDNLISSLAIEPFELVTLFHLIQTTYKLEKYEDLILALRRYLIEKSTDVEMMFCLAGVLAKAGQSVEAAKICTDIIFLKPEHTLANELLKHLENENKITVNQPQFNSVDLKIIELEDLKRLKKYSQVTVSLSELLKNREALTEDQLVQLELLSSECTLLEGNTSVGIEQITSLYKRYPNHSKVLCSYGAILCLQNRFSEAESVFNQARLINPKSDTAIAGVGSCLQEKGLIEEAWSFYLQALNLNCESKRALLGVIQLGHSLGRLKELEDRLRAYLELHPADVDFLYSMAGCLYSQARYKESLDQLDRLRIFDPVNERAEELSNLISKQLEFSPNMLPANKTFETLGNSKNHIADSI